MLFKLEEFENTGVDGKHFPDEVSSNKNLKWMLIAAF